MLTSHVMRHCWFLLAAFLLVACDDGGSKSWQLADGRPAGAPLILYSGRDIYDQSFNESVFRAVETFQSDTQLNVRHVAGRLEDVRHDVENMLTRDPAVVVGIGFFMAGLVEEIAPEYPDTRFLVVDFMSQHPNVQSITFREEEAMFLAGIMAALKGNSNKVGFIAGMDLPVVRKMACSFAAGARSIAPNTQLVYGVVGETSKAWEDTDTPVAISRVLFNKGARVLVVAAGSASSTIHQIYRGRQDIYTVAMDMDANHAAPGSILTSMVKRTGDVVVDAFQDLLKGDFETGHFTRGLIEGGVDVVLDEYNETLIDGDLRVAITNARSQITSGSLEVPLVPDNCEAFTVRVKGTDQDVQDYLDF